MVVLTKEGTRKAKFKFVLLHAGTNKLTGDGVRVVSVGGDLHDVGNPLFGVQVWNGKALVRQSGVDEPSWHGLDDTCGG
jgi:hypothetical protein